MTAAARIVVDIGNTRIKWGMLDPAGRTAICAGADVQGDPLAIMTAWAETRHVQASLARAEWAISSVNPLAAETVDRWLRTIGAAGARWYRSAADVPLATRVREPTRAGADRALAVLAANEIATSSGPGLVVSCGTALTVERIDESGVWEGGAIAPGLAAASSAMQRSTAQLPYVEFGEATSAWGDDTDSAMKAGAFWGTVGALRELIARQGGGRWRMWTGGHAPLLAPYVEGEFALMPNLVPDLVLRGLALAAFGATLAELRHE